MGRSSSSTTRPRDGAAGSQDHVHRLSRRASSSCCSRTRSRWPATFTCVGPGRTPASTNEPSAPGACATAERRPSSCRTRPWRSRASAIGAAGARPHAPADGEPCSRAMSPRSTTGSGAAETSASTRRPRGSEERHAPRRCSAEEHALDAEPAVGPRVGVRSELDQSRAIGWPRAPGRPRARPAAALPNRPAAR